MNVFKKLKWSTRRIDCIAINGARLTFRPQIAPVWFRSGYVWLFWAVIVFSAAFYAPIPITCLTSLPDISLLFWGMIVLEYVFFYYLALSLFWLINVLLKLSVIPLPLISVLVVTAVVFSYPSYLGLIFDWDLCLQELAMLTLFYFLIVEQVLQVLYVSLIHPLVLADHIKKVRFKDRSLNHILARDQEEVNEEDLTVGYKKFVRGSIKYISSVEHYVRVVDLDGEHFIRARIADIARQLTRDEGIQIHRSHIVFQTGIIHAEQTSQKLCIFLKDKSTINVARGRRKRVSEWLRRSRIEILPLRQDTFPREPRPCENEVRTGQVS